MKNADRKLRDSGYDWIGPIPASWQIKRFKHISRASSEKNGSSPIGQMLSVSGYRGIEIKKYDSDNKKRSNEDLSDYRVVRRGQLVVNTMWLNYAGLGVSEHDGYVSPAYRAFYIAPEVVKTFLHHLMRSSAYVSGYTGQLQGIRPNSLQLSSENFANIPILLPPPEEQLDIAEFLDRETAKTDALVSRYKRLIDLIEEKRVALITQAVTKGLDPSVPMKDSGVEWVGSVPAHWKMWKLSRALERIGSGTTPPVSEEKWYGGSVPFDSAPENFAR